MAKTEAVSLGEDQLGKLVEEEGGKEEPAKKRKRNYTDLGSDLGERDEHAACHAMALAMIDEV